MALYHTCLCFTESCWHVSPVCRVTLFICCCAVLESWVRILCHWAWVVLWVCECPRLDSFWLVSPGIRAYEQLGLRAFGHPGKILAAVIITLHNIGGKTEGPHYKKNVPTVLWPQQHSSNISMKKENETATWIQLNTCTTSSSVCYNNSAVQHSVVYSDI